MKPVMIAFSMYSRIPMPSFEWEEADKKRALWFLPLVGAVEGLLFLAAYLLVGIFVGQRLFLGAVLTAVPILLTGGIHMDGFLDTCDARASFGNREKKLEILKDSHIGAFAMIYGALYLILFYGASATVNLKKTVIVSIGFILSRTFCGMLIARTPKARTDGMLADFVRDADMEKLFRAMLCYLLPVAAYGMFWSLRAGMIAIVSAAATALLCRHMMMKEFGGITGDLSGFTIQMCELVILLTQVFV